MTCTVCGTQALMLVTSEGIILAADSRQTPTSGAPVDGIQKISLFPELPNVGFMLAGTTLWLPEGTCEYTGEEEADLDIRKLTRSHIENSPPTLIGDAYLNELGGSVACAATDYFASRYHCWENWMERPGGVPHPGWCKIMLAQQAGSSVIATLRIVRDEVFPRVVHDWKLDRVTYATGAVSFMTNGHITQAMAEDMLRSFLSAVPGIAREPLTASVAATMARHFIHATSQHSPFIGGVANVVLLRDEAPPLWL